MSFIENNKNSKVYAPGYFLAHEECVRETRQFYLSTAIARVSQLSVAPVDAGYHFPMGDVYPSNDSNAIGIVYEDVDVTTGNMPGSVVTKGVVIEDRLAVEISENAKTALLAKGFQFVEETEVTRPY